MDQRGITVLYNSFEQCKGNSRTMKGKSFDITHVELWPKSDGGMGRYHESKENSQTGQDPRQQADIEIMCFHDMEEGEFNRVITCDSDTAVF